MARLRSVSGWTLVQVLEQLDVKGASTMRITIGDRQLNFRTSGTSDALDGLPCG